MKLAVALVMVLMLGLVQTPEYNAIAQPRVVEKIEAPQLPELTDEEKARAEQIALSDPRVLEMITGKSYRVDTGVWHNETLHKLGAVVRIEAEGENFVVFVDLEKEKVARITRIGGLNQKGGGADPLLPAALIILLLSLYFLRKTR